MNTGQEEGKGERAGKTVGTNGRRRDLLAGNRESCQGTWRPCRRGEPGSMRLIKETEIPGFGTKS